jgi:hypothetical protein
MILLCPRCGTPLTALGLGEWFETNPQCQDCGVALGETRAMLRPSPDDVEYGLADWPAGDRAVVTDVLAVAGIPYRWIAGPERVLAVPAAAEDTVDRLLDGFEGGSAVDGDADEDDHTGGDGGETAQAAMADLFVAADRLLHEPGNGFLVEGVAVAGEIVMWAGPPYGIDGAAWGRIRELVAPLLSTSAASGDADAVAAGAQALRGFLVDYV